MIQATDGYLYGTTSGGGDYNSGAVFRIDTSGNLAMLHSFRGSDGASPYGGLVQASDGNLYGTTQYGGAGNSGTVFKIDLAGNFTTLHSFTGTPTEGSSPLASLVEASDGNLYGTTQYGGINDNGAVFRLDLSGNLSTLYSFSGGSDGAYPYANLVQGADGNLYGTASSGGLGGNGTVYKIDLSGDLIPLYSFSGGSDGASPYASVIQATDGNLYGTTFEGGANLMGTVFKMDLSGNLTTLHSFNLSEGAGPFGGLLQATDGNFYGTTQYGGANNIGVIFKMDVAGNLTALYSLGNGGDGAYPLASLVQAADGYLYGTTSAGGNGNVGIVFRTDLAGNLTPLYSFSYGQGANPYASLVQATDGNLYGTTYAGGSYNMGTVFKTDLLGSLTTLHSFSGTDGANPIAGLVQASDGNLYGVTYLGGSRGYGTMFRIDASGNFTLLHSFVPSIDGGYPVASLVQATDGYLYGTAWYGGGHNGGTIFKVDLSGNLTAMYSFPGGNDGATPVASLVQATDGKLYGTSFQGGAVNVGTIFEMDLSGNFATLYAFTGGTDGASPESGLVQGTDGNLYGTTTYGGAGGKGGTVFKMDLSGNLTALYGFTGGSDGGDPNANLVQAADGNLYGTTVYGGSGACTNGVASGCGSIFKIDTAGGLTTLHMFAGTDGANPYGGLTQASDGNLYGAADAGGSSGAGVVFQMEFCLPMPTPSITTNGCLFPNTSGLTASVAANAGDTYNWTITGGTINSGQGTETISFTSGSPATLMTLTVDETNVAGCTGSALDSMQVNFTDVPASNPFSNFICAIARHGVTAGCGGGNFCPTGDVLRSQMAVFLLRGKHGSAYLPPPASGGIFGDVPISNPFSPWIEQIYNEGITGGCSTNPLMYCPNNPVSRGGMAVFLLVAEHGAGYVPPACAGIFTDVACPSPFADWIEELYNEGVTGGCNTNPLQYCPNNFVTRAQMSVFLTVTFALP